MKPDSWYSAEEARARIAAQAAERAEECAAMARAGYSVQGYDAKGRRIKRHKERQAEQRRRARRNAWRFLVDFFWPQQC